MRIFISYAKKDTRELARALSNALEAIDGLTAWMDESLVVAESWALQIQDEIDRSDYVIVLLSPDVNRRTGRRSFVLHEIDYAQQENIPLLPVMAQATKVPIQIAGVQYVNVVGRGADSARLIVEAFCKWVGIDRSPPDSFPPSERVRVPPPRERKRIGRARMTAKSVLPSPFDWCAIPAGAVVLEGARSRGGTTGGRYEVPAFEMAKYPITNAQFRVFVETRNGYRNARWWDFSEAAEVWRSSHAQSQRTWFADDDLPRTKVTWYEAVAFCRWLSAQTGESIRLPTEQQWQRAAQGDDGRAYPWGNSPPNERLCNLGRNVGQTTPVTQYPAGASPFGVMDMSGNVWEWCRNTYEHPETADLSGEGMRVLRGGSWWITIADILRAANRYRNAPDVAYSLIGFRCVRVAGG